MNISSKLKRVKAQADHLFLRGERTDVVQELRAAEDQAESLRLLCEAFRTAVEKTLHVHNTPEEKRLRKVPDGLGAEVLKDALNQLSQQAGSNSLLQGGQQQPATLGGHLLLRSVVEQAAECQQALSFEVLRYDEQVEAEVLTPLTDILKREFSTCNKLKKQLKQVGQDLDNARSRYRNSTNHSLSAADHGKVDSCKEDMDEAEARLEQVKDTYACELFTLISREREMCQLVDRFLVIRQDFFCTSQRQLDVVLPMLESQLGRSQCGPVYGCHLNHHLKVAQKSIAVPIEMCLTRLKEIGLQEEGLFRMAGSASKVKRLRGEFDANLIDETTFTGASDDYNKDYDVHVIASAFKSYLRELPEPLLTYTLHGEWLEAIRTQDREQKLKKLWSAVKKLPRDNFHNLSYVVQFLSLLAAYQSVNKMTPNNIAIVIAPNLIWAKEENNPEDVMGTLGRNMTLGSLYRQIVEQLVECSDYFFDEPVYFRVPNNLEIAAPASASATSSASSSSNPSSTQNGAVSQPGCVTLPRSSGHRRNVSADFNMSFDAKLQPAECESPKQPQRRKKQAPLPPQGTTSGSNSRFNDHSQGNSSSSSPEQIRNTFVPSREAPVPTQSRSGSASTHGGGGGGVGPNAMGAPSLPKFTPPTRDPSVPSTPVPAARLHHSGSIRRPLAEPPKPPVGTRAVAAAAVGANTTAQTSPGVVPPSPAAAVAASAGVTTNTIANNITAFSSGSASAGSSGGSGSKPPPRPQPPAMSALEKSSSSSQLIHSNATVGAGGAAACASEMSMSSSVESSSMSTSSLSGASSAGGGATATSSHATPAVGGTARGDCTGSATLDALTARDRQTDGSAASPALPAPADLVCDATDAATTPFSSTLQQQQQQQHNSHGAKVPIGFEHHLADDASAGASSDPTADLGLPSSADRNSGSGVVYRQKRPPPPDSSRCLGFNLDDSEDGSSGGASGAETGGRTSGTSDSDRGSFIPTGTNLAASSKVFRKSLENVIQAQASGQPLVLPKHQGGSSSLNSSSGLQSDTLESSFTSSREDLTACSTSHDSASGGEDAGPRLVTPPVPAVRTIRDSGGAGSCDGRPEPAARYDKPALPEKPPTLPRPPPSERPPVGPRPASNPNVKLPQANSALDTTFDEAASSGGTGFIQAAGMDATLLGAAAAGPMEAAAATAMPPKSPRIPRSSVNSDGAAVDGERPAAVEGEGAAAGEGVPAASSRADGLTGDGGPGEQHKKAEERARL